MSLIQNRANKNEGGEIMEISEVFPVLWKQTELLYKNISQWCFSRSRLLAILAAPYSCVW